MNVSDRKFLPCTKCPGRAETVGSGTPRIVLYFTDRIEVKCKACGDTEVYWKEGFGPEVVGKKATSGNSLA